MTYTWKVMHCHFHSTLAKTVAKDCPVFREHRPHFPWEESQKICKHILKPPLFKCNVDRKRTAVEKHEINLSLEYG